MGIIFEDKTLINVCESARVMKPEVCARCFWTMDRELNIDGMRLLNKNLKRLAVSSRSNDSRQVVIHAVMQCEYTCQHQLS